MLSCYRYNFEIITWNGKNTNGISFKILNNTKKRKCSNKENKLNLLFLTRKNNNRNIKRNINGLKLHF